MIISQEILIILEHSHKANVSSLSLPYRLEFPMILVANKADLETDRVVSYHEGEELAKTLKVLTQSTVHKNLFYHYKEWYY